MSKLCLVVQRYGLEVNGGAELLCRQLAEQLAHFHEVDVITSKAIDYMTWADEYNADNEVINGVNVFRFSVATERNANDFNEINGRFLTGNLNTNEELEWVEKQGPYVPELIEYIKNNKDNYSAFLFFTYLYYPTVMGIQQIENKSILFSFAHDEPFIYMDIYKKVFNSAGAFYFCTDEERLFIRRKFHNYHIPYILGGAGVDVPEFVSADSFKRKYNLDKYIIYVGRIDEGKNCKELFEYFIEYKKKHKDDLKLVLLGKPVIPVPEREDIVSLGFVSEQDKFDGIAGSECLILPSKFESLSIVILEAFALERPIIVDGRCEVTKAHCKKSNGGFYYYNYDEFEEELSLIVNDKTLNTAMGKLGKKYVDMYYQWDIIIVKLNELINKVTGDKDI